MCFGTNIRPADKEPKPDKMMHIYLNLFPAIRCLRAWSLVVGLGLGLTAARAADFDVTSPGFFYSINNKSPNPTLTLVRGQTYTFAVSTSSIHPFEILDAAKHPIPGTNVVNNNISSGTITFHVPTNAVDYTYICSIHFFGGAIHTVEPPTPPTIRILNLSLGTNLVLTSTGATNWSVIPEFTTSLNPPSWVELTVQSNNFANGTNETFCGRPPGDNVLIRIKSQSN